MSNWSHEELAAKLAENPALGVDVGAAGVRLPLAQSSRVKGVTLVDFKGYNIPQATKVNKYHVADPEDRTYNGKVFRSKKEAEFAAILDLRVKAGEISFWLYEVPFLLPGPSVYKMDFMTFAYIGFQDIGAGRVKWALEFIEVKGKLRRKDKNGKYHETELPMGKLKRRQCEELYPIHIEVV